VRLARIEIDGAKTMNRTAFKVAASTMIVAVTMVACTAQSDAMRRGLGGTTKANAPSDRDAARSYENARRALTQGRLGDALIAIEEAVALSPRDAGYRHLLGEVYLKSGRFDSARAAFADVVELDPSNSRARLSLALMHIASGSPQAAAGQLEEVRGRASAADVGLGFALAGLPERGIEIMAPAAREVGATPRLRQNLALAYALAGDWVRARAIASQDISPAEVPARLQQWAAMARPDAAATRVASLIGVSPVSDPGQPTRLALAPAGSAAPVALAAVESVASPDVSEAVASGLEVIRYADAAPVQIPAAVAPRPVSVQAPVRDDSVSDWGLPAERAEPASRPTVEAASYYLPPTVTPAPAPEPASTPEPTPAAREEARFVAATRTLTRPAPAIVRTASATLPTAPVFRRPAAVQPEATPVRHGNSGFVVQLGAFSNEGNAERAWQQISGQFALNAHVPLTTTIAIDGRVLHRVSVAGFASRDDASRLCGSIRSRGGVCFVRGEAGDASIRWAARYAPGRNRNA
jgi:D-alanyl-D-alanine carboxypeptidase